MKSSRKWTSFLLVSFYWVSSPTALPLPPIVQAEGFYVRGKAAEERGESEIARICYGLALRADPTHTATQQRISLFLKSEADGNLRKGADEEAGGNLKAAALRYALALEADASLEAAAAKLKDLEKNLGMDFGNPSRARSLLKLELIKIPWEGFWGVSLEDAISRLDTSIDSNDNFSVDPINKGIRLSIRVALNGEDPGKRRISSQLVREGMVTVGDMLQDICKATNTQYLVDEAGVSIVVADDALAAQKNPPASGSSSALPGTSAPQPPSADQPSDDPFAPPVWKSKDGKSVEGMFIGLDGEAVMIKRDGKEVTIPFTRLDAESVALAKRMDELKTKP